MAYLNIETKEDSAEKLAAVAGIDSKFFITAPEFNQTVESINNLDQRVSASSNAILVNPGFFIEGTAFILNAGAQWLLSSTIHGNANAISKPIELAASGLIRQDVVILKSNNDIEIIKGDEVAAFPPRPSIPAGTLALTDFPVTDSEIGTPTNPIIGDAYLKKTIFGERVLFASGVTAMSMDGESGGIRFQGNNSSFESIFYYNTDALVDGSPFCLINSQAIETTIRNETGLGTQFSFPNNADYVAQPGEVVPFRKRLNSGVWVHEYVGSFPNYTPQKTVTTNTVLDNSFSGKIIKIKASCTITIPSSLQKDFNCVFRTFSGATATFSESAGVTLDAPKGKILQPLKMATLFKDGSFSIFVLEGALKL